MMKKEDEELNNKLRKSLSKLQNIDEITNVLLEMADIKDSWGKKEGFEIEKDLFENFDDINALRRIANLLREKNK